MHNKDRDVDNRQIIVKLGLGQNPDALILCLDASHHSLSPPILSDSFGYRRARPIEPVERHRDVFVKLGTMVCGSVANTIDNLLWNAIGVLICLHEQWGNRADQDSLFNATLAMPSDISRYFAAAR
jgi:hypothetical protein